KTSPVKEETAGTLVEAMLGKVVSLGFPEKTHPEPGAPVVLSVEGLSREGAFTDVSFEVRKGEIVGLAGLVGSGRSEVARAIFGADRRTAGAVRLQGETARIRSPHEAIDAGVALLPESRKLQGLVMKSTVGLNVTLPHLKRVASGPLIRSRIEYQQTRELLADLDVRPPEPRKVVADLSGGNQQKVLFAKWLFGRPRVLIADEPTAGVDVGAKRAIYHLLHTLAAEGMAVLLISSDLGEVLGMSHRVLAMHRGQIVAEFRDPDMSEERVMHAIFARDEGGGSL
ncbi:MAG: ATP-binding cassette domain-containing protein, partial [Bacillota bacterium]